MSVSQDSGYVDIIGLPAASTLWTLHCFDLATKGLLRQIRHDFIHHSGKAKDIKGLWKESHKSFHMFPHPKPNTTDPLAIIRSLAIIGHQDPRWSKANDGVQLCEVLLCCLTALGGVLLSESRRCKAPVAPPGPGYAEVANEVAKRLNLLQEEVGVPGLGWDGLDAPMVFRIILFRGKICQDLEMVRAS